MLTPPPPIATECPIITTPEPPGEVQPCRKPVAWHINVPAGSLYGPRGIEACADHGATFAPAGCVLQPIAEYVAELPAREMEAWLNWWEARR